jgi:acylpyruvate hydrolase
MKIICIGRNYSEHARELDSPIPKEPVFFMKPETALVKPGFPFFYPSFSNNIHYEVELVVKICRVGKNIQERFAHLYYKEIAVGIDFTARDLQNQCKDQGLPWEKAKAFDGSAPLSKFVAINELNDRNNIRFSLTQNGHTVQQGQSADMLFTIDKLIAYVSQFVTLKMGDYLFTGTPAGVGPVNPGDRLEAFLEEKPMLHIDIK